MQVGIYIVPVFLLIAFFMAFWNKTAAFDDFTEGAKDGIKSVIAIVPNFVGMVVGTRVFLASGIVDTLANWVQPFFSFFNIDATVLPLMILRPLSGSASVSYASELIQVYGPDTAIGQLTSVLLGSSDTTLFVVTVYLAAVGIKNMKHILSMGLIVDLISFILAGFFVHLFFG